MILVAIIQFHQETNSTNGTQFSKNSGTEGFQLYGSPGIRSWGSFLYLYISNLRTHPSHVAIKVLTAKSSETTELEELNILKRINSADPSHPGYKHVIRLVDDFRIKGPHGEHQCIVFEALGQDIKGVRDRFKDCKLPISLLKQVSKQLLLALDYLHVKCEIIHCGMTRFVRLIR
jgi:serine/threonine-protein kinase SRPK3